MTEVEKSQIDAAIRKAGVLPRFVNSRFANFNPRQGTEKALATAREWSEAKLTDRGFFLIGAPGTGKTHLTVAAMMHRIERNPMGEYPRFLNVPLFLDRIRAGMKFTESSAMEEYEYCRDKASYLILDDLGKEKASDWVAERLYVIIESRYSRMLPTIATSNRTLDELDDLGYGAAVSRLMQTCRVVKIDAADIRPSIGRSGT
jgi:DNA replication protein DnaC